jgi:superfamily I DNA and/or RNA helicase
VALNTLTLTLTILEGTKGKIFQCIIDEAGMCTEPECMATIIATKAEQVVLIGDHKQLQPVIMCHSAAQLGLEKSLFERYSDRAVQLKSQYRIMQSVPITTKLSKNSNPTQAKCTRYNIML